MTLAGPLPRIIAAQRRAARAFSLVELLVVIGIIVLLLSLLLPASAARALLRGGLSAPHNCARWAAQCRCTLNENAGYVPRDYTPTLPDRRPYWMVQIGPYLEERNDWHLGAVDAASAALLIAQIPIFHCPEHPLADEGPGTYVVNAFQFESQPRWEPVGPTRLSNIRDPSKVIWITEAVEWLDDPAAIGNFPSAVAHDIFHPNQFPGKSSETISDKIHKDSSNALYFDGSVGRVAVGEFKLEMFDDGIRSRRVQRIHWPG